MIVTKKDICLFILSSVTPVTIQVLWMGGSMRLISVRKEGQSKSLKKDSFDFCAGPQKQ